MILLLWTISEVIIDKKYEEVIIITYVAIDGIHFKIIISPMSEPTSNNNNVSNGRESIEVKRWVNEDKMLWFVIERNIAKEIIKDAIKSVKWVLYRKKAPLKRYIEAIKENTIIGNAVNE